MGYYIVDAMCGHVGSGMYVEKSFPFATATMSEAAQACKEIPRVKHDNKRAILNVREVSYEEYLEQQKINDEDPYLQAKCRRDYFAAGLSYEECKSMDEIDGAIKRKRNNKYDDYCSKKGAHKVHVQHYYEKMNWKEVYNEIGYAM